MAVLTIRSYRGVDKAVVRSCTFEALFGEGVLYERYEAFRVFMTGRFQDLKGLGVRLGSIHQFRSVTSGVDCHAGSGSDGHGE